MKASNSQSQLSSGFRRFRKEWIEPVLIALVLAGIIRTYIIQPFKIPSGSMEDTLLVGDHLMAIKFLYGIKIPFNSKQFFKIRDPEPGDIIVFKFPEDPSKDFIKRCIAVEGQTVELRNKQVYIDGILQQLPENVKYSKNQIMPSQYGPRDNFPPTKIPGKSFFAMGDNRDNSNDSRYWGFVPYENIKGKAFILYWSWNKNASFLFKVRWGRIFNLIK